jgi:hypothetical protein
MKDFKLIVTSNYALEDVVRSEEDRLAIARRFSVIHITELNAAIFGCTKIGGNMELMEPWTDASDE